MSELGPFSLHGLLGRGGMGQVFEGRSPDGQRVAVKILSDALRGEPEMLAAFHDEIRAVAALHHGHIVRIYHRGETPEGLGAIPPGSPFVVMEYAEHGSLAPRRGRLAWSRLRSILLGLLDALAHAHARDVLHRDLKPANVLMLGPGLVPKLTDFGIAHIRREGTQPRSAGTPAYMSPEQLLQEWRDEGPWTDLYAVGMLAWTMITGQAPYRRLSADRIARRALRGQPGPFEPAIEVPPEVEGWVRSLLRPDPSERPQCAADAAWALLQVPSVNARRDTPTDRATELVKEDPGARSLVTEDGVLDFHTHGVLATRSITSRRAPCPRTFHRPGGPSRALRFDGLGVELLGSRAVPFVGREAARTTLWAALLDVHRDRRSRVLRVGGPAGSGRSALLSWIAERAREVGAAEVLRVDAHGWGPALRTFHRAHDLDGAALRQHLADESARVGTVENDDIDTLVGWVSTGGGDLPWLVGHLERRAASGGRPVLIVLDGLHDDEALAHIATSRRLLAFARVDGGDRDIELQPLDEAELNALAEELVGKSPELVEALVARAGGSPATLTTLVTRWAQSGLLKTGPDGFRIVGGLPEQGEQALAAARRSGDVQAAARLEQEHALTLWRTGVRKGVRSGLRRAFLLFEALGDANAAAEARSLCALAEWRFDGDGSAWIEPTDPGLAAETQNRIALHRMWMRGDQPELTTLEGSTDPSHTQMARLLRGEALHTPPASFEVWLLTQLLDGEA